MEWLVYEIETVKFKGKIQIKSSFPRLMVNRYSASLILIAEGNVEMEA